MVEGTESGSSAPNTHVWLLEGMDVNSSYLLNIRLLENQKKGRKYVPCYNFEKIVDSDTQNFKDFVESIVEQFSPGYKEVVHVHYYDDDLKAFPEVKTNHELVSMFHKQTEIKVVDMAITYNDPLEPYEPISEWPKPIDVLFNPKKKQSKEKKHEEKQPEEDTYLANPLPENEYVGVDEDGMYLEKEHAHDDLGKDKDNDKDYVPEEDPDFGSDSENEAEEEEEEEEKELVHADYDKDDPPMTVGTVYPKIEVFKLALAQHAVKHEFEYNIEKSDKSRFRAYCSRKEEDNCPWRIHVSTMGDKQTVQVEKNPYDHECSSTRRKNKVMNASKHWVCEKVKVWLLENPKLGPRTLQQKIKEHHKVKVHYKRVYMGKELALKHIYGDWDRSFNNLYRFKVEVEKSSLGSSVVIDHHTINDKIRFRRMFVALKPCIQGFLSGCRPYLAIDNTFLTGKYKGQLATACAVDGHNWMYLVVFEVFDSETSENWIWFMQRLKEAIGSPRGLGISTDAGQAVMAGVKDVFPEAEHRECMFHLVTNFKKKHHEKVFDDHLWPAAYAWNPHIFNKHWDAMEKAKPTATNYLRKHTRLWTRSQFSTGSKVDYVTNNLAESFNNWIKAYKSMNLDDLMDKIRQLLMKKWNERRKISNKLEGLILPHILKRLNERSRELDLDVIECGDGVVEVSVLSGSGFRCVVNLHDKTCTCRQWQVSSIPCVHALAFITSLSNAPLENYVDPFYSIQKFRTAYGLLIPSLVDKSQWPTSDHGFFMNPPLLKVVAGGRTKTERYKGCTERKKGQHRCLVYKGYGHRWYKCRKGDPDDIAAMMAERGPPYKKKKGTTMASSESSIVPLENETPAPCMSFPPSQSTQSTIVTTKKKRKSDTTSSGKSFRSMSQSGSNQPEAMSIEYPMALSNFEEQKEKAPAKTKGKKRAGVKEKTKMAKRLKLDSPAMGTRSKVAEPSSLAMSTRSKRRLSL